MSLDGTSIVVDFEPLSVSERGGVIVVAVFALSSALALALIALRIVRLTLMLFLKRNNSASRSPEMLFFRTQLGNYAGSLLLSNMFISAAELVDFSWVLRSGVARGSACSAQAVLIQIGIWGTCWFTVAHGTHTLSSLRFHAHPARWHNWVNVGIGWAIAFVAALAPLRQSNVYGPTGTSCGIARSYPKEILVFEALPIILGAVVSATVYPVISIVLHGKLSANSTQELRSSGSASQRGGRDESRRYYKFIRTIVRTMFWLPLAFVLLLLPSCVMHIIYSTGRPVHFALRVFADVCISSLGFVNVVLLSNTFRVISRVYYGPRATKTAAEIGNTSGHETSGESHHIPLPTSGSQPTISSHESGRRAHHSVQPSSNYLGNSWVDWNTKLSSAEKAFYGIEVAAVEPNHYPRNTWPQGESNIWRQDIDFRPDIAVDLPSLPDVALVTGDILHEPSIRDETSTFQRIPDSRIISMAEEPASRSKNPPPLTPSHLPVPRPKAGARNSDNLDKRISQSFSHSSSAPTTLNPDNHLEHLIEVVDIRGVRPLPPILESGDDEQDTVSPHSPTPRYLRTQSYMTVSSVWSQESGYTIRQGES